MGSVFELYRDRAQEYSVAGKANELIFATRKGRGTTVSSINNDKAGLMQDNTLFSNADLCTEVSSGDTYYIVAKQSSTDATRCLLKKTNATIDIVRITRHFTASKVNDYDYEVPLYTAIPCFYEEISGRMMQYDAGLKATSTRRFLVPKLDFRLLDRIKINGNNACIDVINESSYPGLLSVQTSADTRPYKVIP